MDATMIAAIWHSTLFPALILILGVLYFCREIAVPLLADRRAMLAALDIYRIEDGYVDGDPACDVPCTARHCADHALIHKTIAQRRPSRAAEQANVHRWNLPTAAYEHVDVPIPSARHSVARTRFANANPYAVHHDFWVLRPSTALLSATWHDADGLAEIPSYVEGTRIGRRELEAVAA
jgi:hypothetical protein